MDLFAAVDLGASNVRVAIGDERGFRKKLSEKTERDEGAVAISAQIIRMIRALNGNAVEAVGVGSLGPLDISAGMVANPPNMPFKRIPLIEPLQQELKKPVRLLNDCSAAVLGEAIFGAGCGIKNLVYVTLSTGLGAGAIVDGHLLIGKDGNAVEVGHVTIDPHSELVCGCGCRGHWEAYSSGGNLPNYVRLLLRDREWIGSHLHELSGGDPMAITTVNLFAAATEGDDVALWVVRMIGKINTIGFADIVNAYDPELITVGGSVALENPDLILKPIGDNIDKHLINRKPKICITPLGGEAVLYGALALAMKKENQIKGAEK